MDGTPLDVAISHDDRMRALNCCLTTLQHAREAAMTPNSDEMLSTKEYDTALRWLKQQFREKWMQNGNLHKKLVAMDHGKLTSAQKKEVKSELKNALMLFSFLSQAIHTLGVRYCAMGLPVQRH